MKAYFFRFTLLLFIGFSCSPILKETVNDTEKIYSVKQLLKDGKGDFDPWNTNRWAAWYNDNNELIRPFHIDTAIRFMIRETPWHAKFSSDYPDASLFIISKQGITIDGRGIILDVRTASQSLPLEELYALKKAPWEEGNEIRCIFYKLPQLAGVDPSHIKGFTFMGWKRGIKVNGTGTEEGHRLIVEDCIFTRNRIGFYTNGYNTALRNCQLFENGYGAIYSGSKSRRNQFIGNTFRDNTLSQHQHSYGDFIGDTFFDSEISDNTFLKSEITSEFRRIGISIFRNMGESYRLREQMPHNNVIRNNKFDGYSIAIHIGSRMGRNTRNDITGEGRDYAFYNIIEANTVANTTIGIKVNTEGNTISRNRFINVREDIVLHSVFFKMEHTTINYQKGDEVRLWYVLDDYLAYAHWFKFQDDLNGSIRKEEKLITAISEIEPPVFPQVDTDIFQLNPQNILKGDLLRDNRVGNPIDQASGELSLDLPGEEFIAIYNEPISRIGDKDFYSILFFDHKGTEINRCGRSENKWKAITAGYFIRKEGEMEVAAVSSVSENGRYPVYVFDRGYRIPKDTLFPENEDPGIQIANIGYVSMN